MRPSRWQVSPKGVFYNRIEPSFYTGFAHGVRIRNAFISILGGATRSGSRSVLSQGIIDSYLSDLAVRYRTYERLIKSSTIQLTQNRAFEKFSEIISKEKILKRVAERKTMTPAAYGKMSLELLQRLNPERCFILKSILIWKCVSGRPAWPLFSTRNPPSRRVWFSSTICSPRAFGHRVVVAFEREIAERHHPLRGLRGGPSQ